MSWVDGRERWVYAGLAYALLAISVVLAASQDAGAWPGAILPEGVGGAGGPDGADGAAARRAVAGVRVSSRCGRRCRGRRWPWWRPGGSPPSRGSTPAATPAGRSSSPTTSSS
uniref:hypothetical protein n=1 Tax=Nonomuraea gerenzanensis TaxID=93944 RepID=UPI00287FBD53|nr:hypothetical protein [Nonomuraea gerenzanensis]